MNYRYSCRLSWTLAAAGIAVITGCAQPRVQPVFVDLDFIARAKIPPHTVVSLPNPGPVQIAATANLPAAPGQEIRGASTDARRQAVVELIAENRQLAESELAARLREAYLSEVDRSEQEMLGNLAGRKREMMEAAFARIRPLFDDYANKRAPKVVKLSLYVGYPDPDPQSARPIPTTIKYLEKRARDSVTLRKDLQAIDAEYRARVNAEINQADEEVASEIVTLRIELEKQRIGAEERARREAAEQTKLQLADINPTLGARKPLDLRASAGAKVTIQSTPKPLIVSPLSVQDATIFAQARQEAELDAKVWAATTGYVLTSSSIEPDKTNEFLIWRRKRHAGR